MADVRRGVGRHGLSYNASRDVDFLDNKTGRRIELTTDPARAKHVACGGNYVTSSYVAYHVNLSLGIRGSAAP